MYLDIWPKINHLKVRHLEEDSRNVEYSAFNFELIWPVLWTRENHL